MGWKPKFDEICAFFQFFLSELCFIGSTYPQLCSGTYLWHFCIFCDSHSLFVLSAVPSRKEIQIPMSFGFWWRFFNQHKGVFSQYKICFFPTRYEKRVTYSFGWVLLMSATEWNGGLDMHPLKTWPEEKNMDTIGYDWGEFNKRIGIQQPKGIVVLKSGSIMFFHIFSTCVFFMLTRGQP